MSFPLRIAILQWQRITQTASATERQTQTIFYSRTIHYICVFNALALSLPIATKLFFSIRSHKKMGFAQI